MRLLSAPVRPMRGQRLSIERSEWQLGLWDINSVLPSKYVRGEAGYWLATTLPRATATLPLASHKCADSEVSVSNLCWENILTTNGSICNAAPLCMGRSWESSDISIPYSWLHIEILSGWAWLMKWWWLRRIRLKYLSALTTQLWPLSGVNRNSDHKAAVTCDMGRGQRVHPPNLPNSEFFP